MSWVVAETGTVFGVDHFGYATDGALPSRSIVTRLVPADYINYNVVYPFSDAVDAGSTQLDFMQALLSAFLRAREWSGTLNFSGTSAGGDVYVASGAFSIVTPTLYNGGLPVNEWDVATNGPMFVAKDQSQLPPDDGFLIVGTKNGAPQDFHGSLLMQINYAGDLLYASVLVNVSPDDLGANGAAIAPAAPGLLQSADPGDYSSVGQSIVQLGLKGGTYQFVQTMYQRRVPPAAFPWTILSCDVEMLPSLYWEHAKNDGTEPTYDDLTGALVAASVPTVGILP